MVQYRLGPRGGSPVEAVYSQHLGAERCSWQMVRRRGGRPLVFASHGSHASYLGPGTRDRMWPDPNDEADGRGQRVEPRLARIGQSRPRWIRWPERWGARAPAGGFPPSSTRRWARPFRKHAGETRNRGQTRRVTAKRIVTEVGKCDWPEKLLTGGALGAAVGVIGFGGLRRRRRRPSG